MDLEPSLFEASPFPATGKEAIVFGDDRTERIVAVEPEEAGVRLYIRSDTDSIVSASHPFCPWAVTADCLSALDMTPTTLDGEGPLRYLYEFSGWDEFYDARRFLRDNHLEHLAYPSAARQYLLRSGRTLFKGMELTDIVRMQVDIETTSLLPATKGRVLLIALRDNRGLDEVLVGDERELLEKLMARIRERDPDVLEGHNIYGFDLPYLMGRAQEIGLHLGIGRDGSAPRFGLERNYNVGGTARPFVPVYISGRHVIDTYLLVQRFDWGRGELSSYGLKEVAQAYGIAAEERIVLPRQDMQTEMARDPKCVAEYARQDVLETARLADLITPTHFYQTQMAPDSYGTLAVSGTGERINALLVRAYLAAGHSIARPSEPQAYAGGYTDLRAVGVLDRVVKADVESLYPSIMLTEGIHPASDTLGVFLPALTELTRRRIDAKQRARASHGAEHLYWDGLQSSFKVLINSFYGYLGAGGFHFNDPEAAGRVTERGRQIVKGISDGLTMTGSTLIEIDTDGVYFVPPAEVEGEDAERAYVSQIAETLPKGIRLAFDGRYRAMLSLKTKNYVLLGYDGETIFHGASLRSRADEPYGRDFLAKAVELLLKHRYADISELYAATIEAILQKEIPVERLARRERVTAKTFSSASRRRMADAARGVAIGEYVTVYERTNGQLGRVEDYEANGCDEDTYHYMERLYRFALRLRDAIGDKFDRLIERPSAGGLDGQTEMDLFGG